MYLGGFDGFGAAAAMWGASAAGFSVSGVFRDQADFATLYLWDADDVFSHPRWRFLPNFDFTGVVLAFNLAYTGLQPIDSTKYNWIDWATMDVIEESGTRTTIPLASYAAATGATAASVTFTLGGSLTNATRVDLWYLNYAFEFWGPGTGAAPSAATVLGTIAGLINSQVWPAGVLALTATVVGSTIVITAPAGIDGNLITLYATTNGCTMTGTGFVGTCNVGKMSGGTAATSWAVSLNFSGLGLTSIRQLWMTFAPALQMGIFVPVEWKAAFTSWTVTDPGGVTALTVAGPNSFRTHSMDRWASYAGTGWAQEEGWYCLGFAQHTANPGDSVTASVWCQKTFDLYVGTSLYTDRGTWSVSVDGDAATTLDCYCDVGTELNTRRVLRTGLAAGWHTAVLTLSASHNSASSGFNVYFDFLEAAVASAVPDAAATYYAAGVATDFDTNATYQMPPARLVWQILRSGLVGDIDHYLGVYWWAQRKSVGAVYPSAVFTVASVATAIIEIAGTNVGKTAFPTDTLDSMVAGFVCAINAEFIGVWAQAGATGTGQFTVACLAAGYTFTQSVVSGPVTFTGSLATAGTAATWAIDDTVTPVVNRAVRDWHTDWFASLAGAGLTCTVALSMELVNPPDAVGHVYSARFNDGTAVLTATDFDGLFSTQCSFVAAMQAYQGAAYVWMATAMAGAGLVPWLQFGEFVWWFDAGGSPASMAFYDAETAAAFTAAEGRALYVFLTPNDSPAVNGYVDATWLRERIFAHIGVLRGLILAAEAGACFELLWPLDVADPAMGETLNAYVDLPVEFQAQAGSGLNRLKMEALSFGATLRDLTMALQAVEFPWTAPCTWGKAEVKYLVPWFNGGCPWAADYLQAQGQLIAGVDFWAWDHLGLMSWPLPLAIDGAFSARTA